MTSQIRIWKALVNDGNGFSALTKVTCFSTLTAVESLGSSFLPNDSNWCSTLDQCLSWILIQNLCCITFDFFCVWSMKLFIYQQGKRLCCELIARKDRIAFNWSVSWLSSAKMLKPSIITCSLMKLTMEWLNIHSILTGNGNQKWHSKILVEFPLRLS